MKRETVKKADWCSSMLGSAWTVDAAQSSNNAGKAGITNSSDVLRYMHAMLWDCAT